jgi:hypothetical protein|tara:strand:- start:472 stop:822 length:351 start_codon:yes stop_codon:yes gene_type:complete
MTVQVDNFGVNDIILRMKPNFSEEGRWNGFIDMDIITDNENTIVKDDYLQLMQVASLVCSSLPVMEIDEEFRNILCDYVESMVEMEDIEDKKNKVKESVSNTTGNIINVNFKRSDI